MSKTAHLVLVTILLSLLTTAHGQILRLSTS